MLIRMFLVLFGLSLSLLIAEIFLRFRPEQTSNTQGLRYVWNTNYLKVLENGGITTIPNSKVRERALLGDKIEFDVSFQTNNVGLIDKRDNYFDPAATKRIAIVGDSYTAGTGAIPWVPELREQIEKAYPVSIMNLGLIGSGFQNFEKVLTHYNREFHFTNVIILAIDDDWGRTLWYPLAKENGLWFCKPDQSKKQCRNRPAYLELSNYVKNAKNKNYELPALNKTRQANYSYKDLIRPLIGKSKVLSLLNSARHNLYSFYRENFLDHSSPLFNANLAAFNRIVDSYSAHSVTFVRFPAKIEVQTGSYSASIEKYVLNSGAHYIDLWKSCPFELSDYHENDQHFTKAGYEKFSSCFKETVLMPMLVIFEAKAALQTPR